jgi:uncharacterized membrane protein
MLSEKFRRQLREQADLWRTEELIDNSIYEHLSARYQFNTLDTAARNRFVAILLGLGSILIGLGIITFVAANWQELSREFRVILLLSLFVGVNFSGFYFWRQPQEAKKRFGHGLLLLGALILGANMGLMGQMFHISAPFHQLLLAWAVGVLAMAYSLRLTSLGLMSIILMGLGYWGFWGDLVSSSWSIAAANEEFAWTSLLGQHMPLLAGLMFIPLAYWCRSRWIFGLCAIAVVSSLEGNFQPLRFIEFYGLPTNSAGWLTAITSVLPTALLWGYDDSWWVHGDYRRDARSHISKTGLALESFQAIARNLALLCLGILFYFNSSVWFWEGLLPDVSEPQLTYYSWVPVLDLVILSGLALLAWLRIAYIASRKRSRRRVDLTTIVIGVFICISALVPFWHISIAEITSPAVVIFNILLFLLAAGLMREGLAIGQRQAFWGGTLLLTLRILTWFLLSNTELIFKSFMFVLCGVGVIAIGLWFERHVRTLSKSSGVRSVRSVE